MSGNCPVVGIAGYNHLLIGEPTVDGDVSKYNRCMYCGERKMLTPAQRQAMRDWLNELQKMLEDT